MIKREVLAVKQQLDLMDLYGRVATSSIRADEYIYWLSMPPTLESYRILGEKIGIPYGRWEIIIPDLDYRKSNENVLYFATLESLSEFYYRLKDILDHGKDDAITEMIDAYERKQLKL